MASHGSRQKAKTGPAPGDDEPSPEAAYRALAARYGVDVDAAASRGFGSRALKAEGKIFASLSRGRLLLKLPAARVEALVTAKLGERFSTGEGRIKKEWVTVAPASADEWARLAEGARLYVLSQGR